MKFALPEKGPLGDKREEIVHKKETLVTSSDCITNNSSHNYRHQNHLCSLFKKPHLGLSCLIISTVGLEKLIKVEEPLTSIFVAHVMKAFTPPTLYLDYEAPKWFLLL